jgi:hypothetical protein
MRALVANFLTRVARALEENRQYFEELKALLRRSLGRQ